MGFSFTDRDSLKALETGSFLRRGRRGAAPTGVRVAALHLNSLMPSTPLRYGAEATRRLRAADPELREARVAYDAAQDLPAPED